MPHLIFRTNYSCYNNYTYKNYVKFTSTTMSPSSIKLWYLKQIDLFSELDHKDLEYISSCFTDKNYDNAIIISPTGSHKKLYMVKNGLGEISAINEDGKKIIIDMLGSGSFFGNLFADNDLEFLATTKKPSLICTMSPDEFFQLVSKYPQVSEKLMRTLYSQLLSQKQRISSLASESVSQRLVRLIKNFSQDNATSEQPAFTHEELAQMIGTSRQTVTTVLNDLVKQGVVGKTHGKYQLID